MTSEKRKAVYTFVGTLTLTVCLGGAVSACTSSPSSGHPAIFSPGADPSATAKGASASPTGSPSGASSGSPSASSSASGSASPSVSPSASPSFTYAPSSTPAQTSSPSYPAAAPQTGGGGTSGLENGLLFGVGGAAVLAGGGSLALRRKFKALAKRDD